MKKCIALLIAGTVSLTIVGCGTATRSAQQPKAAAVTTQAPKTNTNQVVSDLKYILDQKGVIFSSVPYCTYSSGNDYTCEVDGTIDNAGSPVYPTVTDDGHSIYVNGI